MLTAENITDAQIWSLMRGDHGPCEETRTMVAALNLSKVSFRAQLRARARCAEILNARGGK